MKINIILSIVLLISSCSKKGDPGSNGPMGLNGNANVISRIVTISPAACQSYGQAGVNAYKEIKLSYAELDSQTAFNGATQVYLLDNDFFKPLPTNWFYIGSTTLLFEYQYKLETILLRSQFSNFSATAIPADFTFKIVFMNGN